MGRHSRGRIMSHKASDPDVLAYQQSVGRRPAKPLPKIKEKRLINGKWTRDYDPITGKATTSQGESQPGAPQESVPLTPAQQRMREVAARLRRERP